MSGKLFVVPTPIGNLGDISKRILSVLESVDLIAAEDTRHTLKLLNYYKIKKSLVSYHEHNKIKSGQKLIDELLKGKDIAIVSDAGMPGISDPGADLVKLAIENAIDIEVLPGPTAFVNALIMSGLDTNEFYFIGFLERKKNKRREKLEKLKYVGATMIFYESPHRIKATLKDMEYVLGDRQIAIAREITKKYEEVLRGNISKIYDILDNREIKGEFVIIVSGYFGDEPKINSDDDLSIKELLIKKIIEGSTKKDAIKDISKERNLPKREVYKVGIDIDEKK